MSILCSTLKYIHLNVNIFFKWPLNSFVGYTYVNERDKILHKNIPSDIISDFVFTNFFYTSRLCFSKLWQNQLMFNFMSTKCDKVCKCVWFCLYKPCALDQPSVHTTVLKLKKEKELDNWLQASVLNVARTKNFTLKHE